MAPLGNESERLDRLQVAGHTGHGETGTLDGSNREREGERWSFVFIWFLVEIEGLSRCEIDVEHT